MTTHGSFPASISIPTHFNHLSWEHFPETLPFKADIGKWLEKCSEIEGQGLLQLSPLLLNTQSPLATRPAMLSSGAALALLSRASSSARPSEAAGGRLVACSRYQGSFSANTPSFARGYASKSSGDLFEGALSATEGVKDAGEKASTILKPRIPVQRTNLNPKKMRKHYKHQNFLESVAHKRKVPTSMKKVWHEVFAIRRMPVAKAMSFLEVYPTRSSKHLLSAVRSARANAVWRGFKAEDLEICPSLSPLNPLPCHCQRCKRISSSLL